jgi:cytochrome c556
MMVRIVLTLITLAIGVIAVVAQQDLLTERKAYMKGNNDHHKNLRVMISGEQPYDQAKVDAAFAQWAATAQKFPGFFPDDTKGAENTRALARIWETRDDFNAKVAFFTQAVAENRDKIKSLDDLKANFSNINKACDGCHELYRAPPRR